MLAGERGRGRKGGRKGERERERGREGRTEGESPKLRSPTLGLIPQPWDHDLNQNQESEA